MKFLMYTMYLGLGLSLASATLLPISAAQSATGATPAQPFNSDEPVDISADEADLRQQERLVVLSGNVVAIQGDMRLQANKIHVYYADQDASDDQASENLTGRIDRMEADGNVTLTRPDQTVRSQKAFYKMSTGQVVMSGRVTATVKKNVIQSDRVVVNLTAGTVELEKASGSSGRVRALFVPESADKSDQ